MFDLQEIKRTLEQTFDITFTADDYAGKECIKAKLPTCTLDIYISNYFNETREHIAFMWQKHTKKEFSGFGTGYYSVDEVIERMDYLGYPRRTEPYEGFEQISLF